MHMHKNIHYGRIPASDTAALRLHVSVTSFAIGMNRADPLLREQLSIVFT